MTKKKKKVDPETKQVIAELEEAAEKLGMKVRYEKGNFAGGYCLLKESKLLVINSRNSHDKRIVVLAKCLKEIGIDDVYLKPHIRELIEKESRRKMKDEIEEEAEA